MRQLVRFAALAFLCTPVAAHATEWRGYAISNAPKTSTFVTPNVYESEGAAQRAAKTMCETYSGRTCRYGTNVIAVPDSWTAAAVLCEGDGFIGASSRGTETAVALGKAQNAGYGSRRCDVVL